MPTLQCICSIHSKHPRYFAHSIQSHPCPILLHPSIPKESNPIACGSFFHFDAFRFRRSFLTILSLHCIFIPSATSARKARVLRTLALYCKSQSFYKINHELSQGFERNPAHTSIYLSEQMDPVIVSDRSNLRFTASNQHNAFHRFRTGDLSAGKHGAPHMSGEGELIDVQLFSHYVQICTCGIYMHGGAVHGLIP